MERPTVLTPAYAPALMSDFILRRLSSPVWQREAVIAVLAIQTGRS
jgi:hypothetical protein